MASFISNYNNKMLRSSLCASDGNFLSTVQSEDLSEIIEDLELSLDVNKSLFKDIIHSKKSNHHQNSEETDKNLFITSKSLEIVQIENTRLIDSINRMNGEISHADTLISIAQERAKESRLRRKKSHAQLQEELKSLKESIQTKEEEIRNLEKYSTNIEELLGKSLKQESINPGQVIADGKKLVNKISKQLETALSIRDIEERKCREAENEIKRLQAALKVGAPVLATTTDKILKKQYTLNINYENFWFVGLENNDDVSDSIRSSASSVQDQQFPSKFEFTSKSKPKIPKLKFLSRTLTDIK